MRTVSFVWMMAISACSMPPPGRDGGGDVDAGANSCLGADAAVCSATGCVGITGWRSTGAPSVTSGPGEYAGCATPSDLLPGTTYTCAASPADGVCWFFRDTRVPEGWATLSCLADLSLYCPSAQ